MKLVFLLILCINAYKFACFFLLRFYFEWQTFTTFTAWGLWRSWRELRLLQRTSLADIRLRGWRWEDSDKQCVPQQVCQFFSFVGFTINKQSGLRGFLCVAFLCSKTTKTVRKLRFELCFLVLLSQDWQEIVSLYEADNVYLGECNIKTRENTHLNVFNIYTHHMTYELWSLLSFSFC